MSTETATGGVGVRVLVCGGRTYNDHVHVYDTLNAIQDERGPISAVIAGRPLGEESHGEDYCWAESWSFMELVPFYGFPARWSDLSNPDAVIRVRSGGKRYDAKAGPRRNQRMIDEGKPDLVVAFSGGAGTADMIRRARAAGIVVIKVPSPASMERT